MRVPAILLTVLLGVTTSVFGISQAEVTKAFTSSYQLEYNGYYLDAIKALEPALKNDPKGYVVNLRKGYLHYLSQQFNESIDYYNKAIAASPMAVDAKLGKIMVLLAQGNYKGVESEGSLLVKMDNFNYLGNLRLAFALRMQKKFDFAEKVVAKMLKYYPVDLSYLAEFGILKYANGDYAASKKVFNEILTLDPSNALAYEYIALIEKQKK